MGYGGFLSHGKYPKSPWVSVLSPCQMTWMILNDSWGTPMISETSVYHHIIHIYNIHIYIYICYYIWCSVGHHPPPTTNGYGSTVSSGSSGPPPPVACGGPPPVDCAGGMYLSFYLSIYLSMYVCTYVCMYVSKYVCMYVWYVCNVM